MHGQEREKERIESNREFVVLEMFRFKYKQNWCTNTHNVAHVLGEKTKTSQKVIKQLSNQFV